jgi:16S rRNA (uracil1498-N3)-methyltransferase
MHLFYYPDIDNEIFTLNKTESSHCVRVLRLKAGDIIHLTDGRGRLCKAQIVTPDKNKCVTRIIEAVEMPREKGPSLLIAIAPTKNLERFEWFLEKATEIGTDTFIPLICKNSERKSIKPERLQRVIASAMKQSLKYWMPQLAPVISFRELVTRKFNGSMFIATKLEPGTMHLGSHCRNESDIMVLIGPEGDFDLEEINLARQNGFIPVSLGESRLRTETAGVVACHTVNLIRSLSGL